MITFKFKYKASDETLEFIQQFKRQYSSCLHFLYNRICDNSLITNKELRSYRKQLNNIDLIDSWLFESAIGESKAVFNASKRKVIFGGRKNFFDRCKRKISKDEFNSKRISPAYICGEAPQYGNRKCRITEDLNVIFKLSRNLHFELRLLNIGNRKKDLIKLYNAQNNQQQPITYKISNEYVWITFDESILYANDFKVSPVEGRVMSIDMNPNYIGWSIVNWAGSTENDFEVIKSGVISIKKLNDKDKEFKGKHLASNSKERTWLSSKRTHETLEISKKLVSIALHYRCQLFAVEELSMKASDKGFGKSFNKLVNNQWCRSALTNNLKKRCNIFGIKLLEVKPEYSSFIGNFLFRSLNLPDMVLASIEIGRRGFELYNQYTTKKNKIQKNIVKPNLEDFNRFYSKSLEEFGMESSFKDLVELYYFFKKSKLKYRLSLDQFDLKFYRMFSIKSNINHIILQ